MPAVMLRTTATLILMALPLYGAFAQDTHDKEAAALAKEFVSRLKPELQSALGSGDPAAAIDICSHKAPLIADTLTTESGWTVKRVSLKARNASRARPDSWEQAVLEDFDRRAAAGEKPADIRYAETTPSHYRYLQAQGTDGLCLVCHGTDIAPGIQATLDAYYPDDMATGYSTGQVRGAISLTKVLN